MVTGLSGQYTQVLSESSLGGRFFFQNFSSRITTCDSLCIQGLLQTHFYHWLEWFKDGPVQSAFKNTQAKAPPQTYKNRISRVGPGSVFLESHPGNFAV